jgi:hypothetical protein
MLSNTCCDDGLTLGLLIQHLQHQAQYNIDGMQQPRNEYTLAKRNSALQHLHRRAGAQDSVSQTPCKLGNPHSAHGPMKEYTNAATTLAACTTAQHALAVSHLNGVLWCNDVIPVRVPHWELAAHIIKLLPPVCSTPNPR